MRRSRTFIALHAVLVAGFTLLASVAGAQVSDNFQSYTPGTLPGPTWLDAGAVLPFGRIPSFPSGFVINTTDAFGKPTKAVTTVGDIASSKGILATVPVSTFYTSGRTRASTGTVTRRITPPTTGRFSSRSGRTA